MALGRDLRQIISPLQIDQCGQKKAKPPSQEGKLHRQAQEPWLLFPEVIVECFGLERSSEGSLLQPPQRPKGPVALVTAAMGTPLCGHPLCPP